jgi:queuine tRNA-ribosyltransferase
LRCRLLGPERPNFHLKRSVNLRNARHANAQPPIPAAPAPPAGPILAFICIMWRAGEIIGAMLLTWHNLAFYQDLVRSLREVIGMGAVAPFAARFLERYRGAETDNE